MLEEIYRKAVEAGRLLSVHLEVTRHCNLSCSHCYVTPCENAEMSGAELRAALDKLADAGALFLTLTGGEPLTREDFFEAAEYARRLNFSVRVFTNGTLVDERAADRLAGLSPFEVGVSVYGVRAETHDGITGTPGSFDATMKGIGLLRERGVRVTVKSVIMKPNFGEYGELIDYARGVGARYVFDATVFPRDDGGRGPLELRIGEAELEAVMSDARFQPGGGSEAASRLDKVCRGPVCDLNFVSVGISPEGDVYPCLQLRRKAGNILKDEISEIRATMSHIIHKLTSDKLKECYNCTYWDACTRCAGLALLEDGDAAGRSEWACGMARIRERIKSR